MSLALLPAKDDPEDDGEHDHGREHEDYVVEATALLGVDVGDVAAHWGCRVLNEVSKGHVVGLVHVREDLRLAHVSLEAQVPGGEALAVDEEGSDAKGVLAIEGFDEETGLGLVRSMEDDPVVPGVLQLALGREVGYRIHRTEESVDCLVLKAL